MATPDVLVGVCGSCVEIHEGNTCPRCGQALERSLADFESWERERIRKRVTDWMRVGSVKRNAGMKLLRELDERPAKSGDAATKSRAKPPRAASQVERGGDKIAAGASAFTTEVGARFAALVAAIDSNTPTSERAPASVDENEHDDTALDAGRAVFARDSHPVVGAGVDALTALDDEPSEPTGEAKPLGALQVFWFIGVILVLAGSVMGVREAWRTLEGVMRQLVIGGALFVYHVLFVALSRVLVRRSHVTGRVLAGIAAALLPIAFVAVASAVGSAPRVGLPFAIALLLASSATLFFAGGAYGVSRGKTGLFLAAGLVPALVLELPLAAGPTALTVRTFVPLAALVPLALASARLRLDVGRALSTRNAVVALSAAAYGAMAVALFAVFGGPLDATLDLSSGTPAQLFLTVWIGLFGAIAWWSAAALEASVRHARIGILLSIVSLALLIGASIAGAASAFASEPARGAVGLAPFGLAVLATAVLVVEQRRRLGVIHLVAPMGIVSVLLLARVFLPQEPLGVGVRGLAAFPASAVLVPAMLLAGSALSKDVKRRRWASAWGVVSGLAILGITLATEMTSIPSASFATGTSYAPFTATAFAAGALAVCAHAGARTTRAWLHVYGALAALVAVAAVVVPMRRESAAESIVYVCAALAALYGLAAFPYVALVKNAKDSRRPFDDVSLLFAVIGLAVAIIGSAPTGALTTTFAEASALYPRAAPVAVVGALLFVRAGRDASAIVTGLATVAFVYAVRLVTNVGTAGEACLLAGALALGTIAVSTLRGKTPADAARYGRAIAGFIPLPLGARGRILLDGVGLTGSGLAGIAGGAAMMWIATPSRLERGGVIFGMLAVIIATLVAFGTRALDRIGARGSFATLALGGVAVGICAIGNRIGRPLPPAIVGRNLTVVIIGVWLLSRAVVRYGPKLGEKLGRPTHGPQYHLVPHLGVLAVSLLLVVDAWLVGVPTASRALAVTPPMMLLGAAIGGLLLYRSFGFAVALHFALGALFGFAILCAAQQAVFGPVLIPLDLPGGRWVPEAFAKGVASATADWLDPRLFLVRPDTEDWLWSRALTGASLFVAIASLLVLLQSRVVAVGNIIGGTLLGRGEDEHQTMHTALSIWACIGAVLLGLNLSLAPSIAPAILLLGAGVVLVLARGQDNLGSAYRAIVVIIGAPLVVHALANQRAVVPAWAGPALAILPLGISLAASIGARRRERGTLSLSETELGLSTLVAVTYGAGAIAYALAAGGATDPRAAAPRVLNDAFDAVSAVTWAESLSLAVTLAALALAAAFAASIWRGGLAKILGLAPPLLLALAGAAATAALVFRGHGADGADVGAMLVYGDGALTGAFVAGAALVAHVASVVSTRIGRSDLASGLGAGRDLVLLSALAIIGAFVLGRAPDAAPVAGLRVGPMGVLALGLSIVVSIDAAVREKTSRHVMFVEILLVALYAFATRELDLRPEIHAILGLGYGFSLLGVAIIARRRGIKEVSIATRRFAAILPIIIAILTAKGLTDGLAMLALGSSLLYGAMAMVEKSRLLGSLAALAANAALVVFALAQGLDGIEVYVGPLGLLVTALSQLFAPKMNAQARSFARVIGGLLLYLPAGLKLTFRLGAATDGTYSVVFGAVCLLGLVAGLVLQVRAYLALGTLFITLDVIANLVYAGLRDHRVGFVLLSVSGLLILGVMIVVTLKRDQARALLFRVRSRFRAWD